jgi:hypothetical protein
LKINICKVKFDDLNLTPRYGEKLRGYLGNKYKEIDLLHNHDQDKFIYRYPLVQYKVTDNIPMMIGINEAANIVAKIGIDDDEFILDNKKYDSFQKQIIKSELEFGTTDDYVEYEFTSPWIALNQMNINKYKKYNNVEKEEMLKKIIIGNIISLSKGLNYTVDKKISTWINFYEIKVMLKGIKHIAFKGNFKVNFNIPDYLGIGKSVSRGFGTIKRV